MTVEPLADIVTGEIIELAMTPTEARDLTDKIRQTLHVGHDLIVQAFKGSAWSALGYSSWDAYCAGEFAGARMVRLDREQRREIVAEMRQAGMSNNAIAAGIGLHESTVRRDIADVAATTADAVLPARTVGADGKERPAAWTPERRDAHEARKALGPSGMGNPQAKRRPLPDAYKDALYDLTKVTERIGRLHADDRFPQNAEQVAARHRNDLLLAREAIDRALAALPNTGV